MHPNLIPVVCFCLLSLALTSQVISIPGDFETIQEGIDAASVGDTVLVAAGEYYENLNLTGKDIVLCSHYALSHDPSDILATIINGSQPVHPDTASCILIISSEGPDCVIQGFTIKEGTGTVWEDEHGPGNFYREGGGILIQAAAPTIKDNRFIGNQATNTEGVLSAGGGAIRCGDGNPTIINNTFLYNLARYGAGIVLNYSDATIMNNIIAHNAGGEDFGGAGIWALSNADDPVVIENNTIVYNHSNQVGGGIRLWSCTAAITNNIIWGNFAFNYAQVAGGNNLTYNCVQNGFFGEGNIDTAPGFEDDAYLLSDDSPCIDAGNPDPSFNDPEDPNNPGSAAYPAKGTLHNDMGVYGGAHSRMMTSVLTGLARVQGEEGQWVHVFPNPAGSSLNVSLHAGTDQPAHIKIHDLNMRQISEIQVNHNGNQAGSSPVDLQALKPGFYFLTIQAGDRICTKKIVKN